MFGILLLIPFYLERGLGLGSARAGLELMAMPLAFGIVAPFAGRLADHVGARPLTVSGMTLVTLGLVVLGAARPSTIWLLVLLAVIGVGMGLFTSPNNASIMGAAPEQQAGMASGVLNMSRGMGTALGLAVTGSVFVVAGGDHSGAAGRRGSATRVHRDRLRSGGDRRRSGCDLRVAVERETLERPAVRRRIGAAVSITMVRDGETVHP